MYSSGRPCNIRSSSFMEEGLSEQEIVDKLKDQYPEADIRTSVSECEKTERTGYAVYQRYIRKHWIDEFTENRQTVVVKALCLHIAHDLCPVDTVLPKGEYHGRKSTDVFLKWVRKLLIS